MNSQPQRMEEDDETQVDYFDRLPDPLLLFIFNKLQDAKSLALCLSVSKRFASLAPLTHTVSLTVPPRLPHSDPSSSFLSNLVSFFVSKFISKALRCFDLKSNSCSAHPHRAYYTPNQVLQSFQEIKSLYIEIPSHVDMVGSDKTNGSLFKWKAEFGSELKSCIILQATYFQKSEINSKEDIGQEEEFMEQILSDDELKLRVIWTISCLIAASARHHLLKQILADRPSLQNVKITDRNNQGDLCMGKEQLSEVRNSMKSADSSSESSMERTPVPDLSVKLWYVPVLELPAAGRVMTGTTLVVIRPVADRMSGKGSGDDGLLAASFDGEGEEKKALGEAVRKMMKLNKCYKMTMSSF